MTKDNIDPGEFEWGPAPSGDSPSEESSTDHDSSGGLGLPTGKVSRSLPAVLVAILLVGALLGLSGGATANTTFTASDVSVSSHNGDIKALSVAPDGYINYRGLESTLSTVTVEVQVKKSTSSTWETVDSKNISASGLTGNVTYDFTKINILQQSTLSKQDFEASDGQTSSTDVDVRVKATFVGSGPDGSDVTAISSDTFTVEVTNIQSGGGVNGNANTNGK